MNKDDKEILSKDELFLQYAPSFNFELDKDQLVAEGIKRGFITEIEKDQYLVNPDY